MKFFLIGHRGTGKSTFLKSIQKQKTDFHCLDLDSYIEEREGMSIQKLFSLNGEAHFRELEKKYFREINTTYAEQSNLILSLGAGFDLDLIDQGECVWISRPSDFDGRIFLDRPTIGSIPAHPRETLDNYFNLFERRHPKFLKHSRHRFLCLEEGGVGPQETDLFFNKASFSGASQTLCPDILGLSDLQLAFYFKRLIELDFKFIELRTDLFTSEDIKRLWQFLPPVKALLSLRTKDFDLASLGLLKNIDIDEALFSSYKLPEKIDFKILSSHSANPPQERPGFHLKWSPQLKSIHELSKAWPWQKLDPKNRSLLPRSSDPALSFHFFRLFLKDKQTINFIKERCFDFKTALQLGNHDQPTAVQWLKWNSHFTQFAAVLGYPIKHSLSPGFHFEFFEKRKINFTAIGLAKESFREDLAFLQDLGLVAAAVTSPLKEELFLNASLRHSSALSLQSANTLLVHTDGQLEVWNTDLFGLEFCLRGLEHLPCAVIGGGGTKEAIKTLLPSATFYSARTLERNGGPERGLYPLVVWAAGGSVSEIPENFLPPSCFSAKVFLDLDYRDNSTGRAVASFLKTLSPTRELRYISGHKMFFKQAKAQQDFWSQHLS